MSRHTLLLYSRGASEIAEITVSGIPASEAPAEFSLGQNYLNPFNPSTLISCGVPVPGHVKLRVYNMLGQEVAVLQNGEQEVGYHEVTFDASGLSSGMYMYRLQAGDFTAVRKLMLLK